MSGLTDKVKQLGISHFTVLDFVNEIEALRQRVAELEEWNRQMVAKAATGGVLDGYREMGQKLAACENQRDSQYERNDYLQAQLTAANARIAELEANSDFDHREYKRLRDELKGQLAASQHYAKQLREAVLAVLCDPEGVPCFDGSDGDRKVIADALTIPHELAACEKEAELADFVAALKETEREAKAVIEAVSVDVPVTVPPRDYESMTPNDCYEAGLIDGGMAVRQAIRIAIAAALMPNAKVQAAGASATVAPATTGYTSGTTEKRHGTKA